MSAERLESFLDDPAASEALSVAFERSDGGSEELQWADVRDALSADQWGRLIRAGVLVGGDDGFVLADPDRVERAVSTGEESVDGRDADDADDADVAPVPDDDSWEWYDKVAGVATLGLFMGYWNTGIRDVIASLDDVVLAPATHALPFYAVVLLLALVTGFYSTVLQAKLMDAEKLQRYKDRMNELRERKAAAKERGDEDALERVETEQMDAASDQLGMFKLQFRPMVWIMLLTIPVFLWLRWKVRGGHLAPHETGLVVPLASAVAWQEPLVGPMRTWIVWYFLCSVAARQIFQKTLDVQTTSVGT
ncbi:MAG: DUF106 domain-containing protein [Haloplanus sp.]